jgi:hypothetical protein
LLWRGLFGLSIPIDEEARRSKQTKDGWIRKATPHRNTVIDGLVLD